MPAATILRIFIVLLALPTVAAAAYLAIGRTLREPPGVVPATEHTVFERSSCLECHSPIADEWRESFHFRSLTGPFWQRIRDKGFDDLFASLRVPCVNCHAPANVLDLPERSHPRERTQDRELGVDCVSCHVSKEGIRGPGRSVDAPHEVIADIRFRDPELASTTICASCHDEALEHARTVTDWRRTELARRGVTCLHCHMPEVMAPTVERGPARLRRSHRFPGDKDPQFLRSGLNAVLEIVGNGEAVLRITNDRIGHSFPASGTNFLIVKLTARDPGQRLVQEVEREFGTREWIPGYLDFWPFLKVTKIPAGESREVRVRLPAGHGTVTAEFRYRDWFAIRDEDRVFHTIVRRF